MPEAAQRELDEAHGRAARLERDAARQAREIVALALALTLTVTPTLTLTLTLTVKVRLWDAKTLNLLKCYDAERPLNSARISP